VVLTNAVVRWKVFREANRLGGVGAVSAFAAD
jgi:hypothetical protein